ncbi:MAG: trypsin-like peptidase domain-containing protein [Proteobacteria bacterium]|nr:trypsin-like peptidase domain-containing protein [Pseudomonadota bacterium]
MPRLPDDRLDVAVYFYDTLRDAEEGTESGGTGFWISFPFPEITDRELLCIVTNKHVIEKCHAVRLNRKDAGPPDCITIEPSDVFLHSGPHDLALVFVSMDAAQTRYNAIPTRIFLSRETAREYAIGIGDDVYIVGRFIGHEGEVHNEPTVRFGNISASNRQMRNAETGLDEDSFAVETRSKPGYSGSPVVTYGIPATAIFRSPRSAEKRSFEYLLGVLWGQIHEKRPLIGADGKEVGTLHITEASGLSGVVPAWHILSLLDQADVKKNILSIQQQVRAAKGASPSANTPSGPLPGAKTFDTSGD